MNNDEWVQQQNETLYVYTYTYNNGNMTEQMKKKQTERKESGISRQINMVVRLGCALSISFHPEKCSTWCFRNSRLIVHVPQKPYNTSWSLVYSIYFAAVWNSITFVPKIKRRMHSSSLSLSLSLFISSVIFTLSSLTIRIAYQMAYNLTRNIYDINIQHL